MTGEHKLQIYQTHGEMLAAPPLVKDLCATVPIKMLQKQQHVVCGEMTKMPYPDKKSDRYVGSVWTLPQLYSALLSLSQLKKSFPMMNIAHTTNQPYLSLPFQIDNNAPMRQTGKKKNLKKNYYINIILRGVESVQ